MISLLESTDYIGQAFQQALEKRGQNSWSISRFEAHYARFIPLYNVLKEHKSSFIVNAVVYTGKPNMDACETATADNMKLTTLSPQAPDSNYAVLELPWGHVSSGCQVKTGIGWLVEKDMIRPKIQSLATNFLDSLLGFKSLEEAFKSWIKGNYVKDVRSIFTQ